MSVRSKGEIQMSLNKRKLETNAAGRSALKELQRKFVTAGE
jgi:hypothetical protein